jgi:hypothetical protein
MTGTIRDFSTIDLLSKTASTCNMLFYLTFLKITVAKIRIVVSITHELIINITLDKGGRHEMPSL